jgi:PPP family 3-phenylpropionic acid transporter
MPNSLFIKHFRDAAEKDFWRLALLYSALFWVVGVQMPFWPLWLKDQGMGAIEIGILLGAIYWAKVVTNPLIAQMVDRYGHRKTIMIVMILCAAALYLLYPFASDFDQFLILGVLGGSLLSGLMPLTETVTMALTREGKLDYGRVRLWGSFSFIALVTATGWLVDPLGSDIILWLVLLGIGLSIICVFRIPDPPLRGHSDAPIPFSALFKNKPYLLFLITAALTQASHAVYYGFGTLNWQQEGLSSSFIGLLWAVGVLAEILLFAFSGRVVRWIKAEPLLMIGAASGVVRWFALALTHDPLLLMAFQCLHAATFGATHLAAMHLISEQVAPRLQARGQALYSSVAMGLIPGVALLGAGPLFEQAGGQAYFATAAISVGACVVAFRLLRLKASPQTTA